MNEFDRLIGEQVQTMDRLLYLQTEIERCKEMEQQFMKSRDKNKVDTIQEEIVTKTNELVEIQEIFEKQTEEVIRCFQLR